MYWKIKDDMKAAFGIDCGVCTPVEDGWLNKKWKVETAAGVLLVKQYSSKRFSITGLEAIDRALGWQIELADRGVKCPRLYRKDGHILRTPEDGVSYMVMDFCEGEIGSAETITLTQLGSLGEACGKMKREFAALSPEGARDYPIDGAAVIAGLREYHDKHVAQLSPAEPEAYRRMLALQEPILASLTAEWLDGLAKSLTHEDFSPDNMLFDESGVTAILDFDRTRYGFVLHDVGRALLSLALIDGVLDAARIRAFAEGYRAYMPFGAQELADALRIAWCVEAPWWIHPAMWREPKEKIARFRDELCWLTENFARLDEMAEEIL